LLCVIGQSSPSFEASSLYGRTELLSTSTTKLIRAEKHGCAERGSGHEEANSGLLVTMLTLGLLALASSVKPARASPATITVTDDYPTIQLAINALSLGDTVRMKA
jgi:hypothetical protein